MGPNPQSRWGPGGTRAYLLDLGHLPDERLIIDQGQQLLQLTQVRQETLPDFLENGKGTRGFCSCWDLSPVRSPMPPTHSPSFPDTHTALPGSAPSQALTRHHPTAWHTPSR